MNWRWFPFKPLRRFFSIPIISQLCKLKRLTLSVKSYYISMSSLQSFRQGCMGKLLNDQELADVTFKVGNNGNDKVFYGIRSLFAAHSIVFKRMLYGSMLESSMGDQKHSSWDDLGLDENENCILISDISPSIFDWFMQFIYGLDPSINDSNVIGLYYFSDKYLIRELNNECIDFIVCNVLLDKFNLCELLESLTHYGMSSKIVTILKEMKGLVSHEQCIYLLKSDFFLHLNEKYIHEWLFDTLKIHKIISNEHCFLALKRWCQYHCQYQLWHQYYQQQHHHHEQLQQQQQYQAQNGAFYVNNSTSNSNHNNNNNNSGNNNINNDNNTGVQGMDLPPLPLTGTHVVNESMASLAGINSADSLNSLNSVVSDATISNTWDEASDEATSLSDGNDSDVAIIPMPTDIDCNDNDNDNKNENKHDTEVETDNTHNNSNVKVWENLRNFQFLRQENNKNEIPQNDKDKDKNKDKNNDKEKSQYGARLTVPIRTKKHNHHIKKHIHSDHNNHNNHTNHNNEDNNGEHWTRLMKRSFMKYISFQDMNPTFYFEYIDNLECSRLLSKEYKYNLVKHYCIQLTKAPQTLKTIVDLSSPPKRSKGKHSKSRRSSNSKNNKKKKANDTTNNRWINFDEAPSTLIKYFSYKSDNYWEKTFDVNEIFSRKLAPIIPIKKDANNVNDILVFEFDARAKRLDTSIHPIIKYDDNDESKNLLSLYKLNDNFDAWYVVLLG